MGGRSASSGMSASTSGFKVGATPKDINPNKNYKVTKTDSRGKTIDYGNLSGTDVKSMLKGYSFNGLFWEKNKTITFYELKEV